MNFKDYLTTEQAAEFLGITGQTLRRWVKNGKLKSYRNPINGFFLFKKEDLEEVLNNMQPTEMKNNV